MDDVSDRIVQAGLDRLAVLKVEKERIAEELSLLLKEIQSLFMSSLLKPKNSLN